MIDPDGKHHPHPDAASGGRHPLPSREKFAMWLSSVGFANEMQAVVYDRNGANYCGRLWWMLKWAGHEAVAVLDGGLQAWQAAGGEMTDREEPSHFQSNFALGPELRSLATTKDVLGRLDKRGQTIIDARATPRFKGEVEPFDPVAGHIPGALNRPSTAEHRPRRQVQARGPAASRVRTAAGRAGPGHGRASLRQRRQCVAQHARDGSGGPGPHGAVCRQLERMVQRSQAPGRERLALAARALTAAARAARRWHMLRAHADADGVGRQRTNAGQRSSSLSTMAPGRLRRCPATDRSSGSGPPPAPPG